MKEDRVVELILQRGCQRRLAGGIEAFSEVLEHPGSSRRQRAIAWLNRGALRTSLGERHEAFDDWSQLIQARGIPFWLTARAALARGQLRLSMQDAAGAVCDFTLVICLGTLMETHQEAVIDARVMIPQDWSPLELAGRAIVCRGRARGRLGDFEGAMVDLLSVFSIKGLSKRMAAAAWARLAEVHFLAGRYQASARAIKECASLDRRYSRLNLLGALGSLAEGDVKSAVDQCLTGLAWVRSTRSLDYVKPYLKILTQRHGKPKGIMTVKTLLQSRRRQLETYAPTSLLDGRQDPLSG